MNLCSKCSKQIKSTELKTCSKCSATFHYSCIGVSADTFSKESKAYKATWKCSDCRAIEKRGENSNTPQHASATCNPKSPAFNNEDLKLYIDKKLEESLAKLLLEIKRNFKSESADTRNKIQELTDSVQFMSSKCDQLSADALVKSKKIDYLETQNTALQSQVADLSKRLNYFEQQSRDCNLEIQCVPEHKSENLLTIVRQLATTVGHALPDHDLSNYHRVAKVNPESNRPRAIIAKLSSPLARDKFLAAVKVYNRAHQNDKLNTSHLGFGGERKPVFVCEHLSPANKQLHAEIRKTAKAKNYQFVWVRNGHIFVRKDFTSKSILVKDSDFLKCL